LTEQQRELQLAIADLKNQQSQLAAAQSQQSQMLAYTEGQKSAFDQQIRNNKSAIAELRRQQIAANSRFIGGGSGSACGGGYPGKWCNIPQDSVIDDWGMYNRECVSYTAFRVWASGRVMPWWGGVGNANQWDDDARADRIPVDSNPQPGDVAISNAGFYGHAMYVESVNDDGTINISQYNASLNGLYSTRSGLSPAGLVFIHF
jgi:surface antigen